MSEKMYYVKDLLTGDGAWVGKDIYGVVSGSRLKPTIFTKSELANIRNGALYKRRWRDLRKDIDFGEGWEMKVDWEAKHDYWEWINPLIELVPVEDIV